MADAYATRPHLKEWARRDATSRRRELAPMATEDVVGREPPECCFCAKPLGKSGWRLLRDGRASHFSCAKKKGAR